MDQRYCECGCGTQVKKRFVRGHNALGRQDPRRGTGTGYIRVGKSVAYEHRVIVERLIGMKLPHRARIHHVNGDKKDNRPGNLVVCNDDAHHMLIHYRQEAFLESGDANNLKCMICKRWDTPENIRSVVSKAADRKNPRVRHYHAACHNEKQRSLRANA